MAALTTNANLTGGVGEFPPVPEHELKSLLEDARLTQGLTEGMTAFHEAAWERAQNDFGLEEVDVTGTLSTSLQTLIKAACCFRIMADLHRRAANGDKKSDHWNAADWNESEYDRMKGRMAVAMPQGVIARIGNTIHSYRG